MNNLILLIPGNPSVPGIYEPFLDQVLIDFKLEGETFHKVLPHLGQCNKTIVKKRKISLSDVIDDHRQTIRKLLVTYNPNRVFIIGHSLGSAVTISLYEEFTPVVEKFFILCPFLGPSKNNMRYLKLFKNPVSRIGLKGLTYAGLSNEKVSHFIFNKWLGDTPFNQHIPKEIKKPLYLKNFFSLVSTYFEEFEQLEVKEKVKSMKSENTFFLFAPCDFWVPDETLKELPIGISFKKCHGISHDFCLRKDQYMIVSKSLSTYFSASN